MHKLQKIKSTLSKAPIIHLEGHTGRVQVVRWCTTGKRLATGSSDRYIRIWDATKLHDPKPPSQKLMGHQSAIITLAWDPSNSNRLATAGDDKTIGIWDMRTKRPTQFLSIGEPIISVSWSPDGLQLAACDKKDRISLIDTRTFTTTYTSPPFDYEVEEVMFLPSYPQYLMFPTSTGAIRIFDVVELKEKPPLRGHTSNVYCMDVAKGGKYVAAGSADAISSIWDMEEMMYKTSIHGIRSAVRAVSFSHDSQLLASGLEDGSVDVSSVEFGETVHIIQGKGNVNTCAWHPDKLWLAYAGDDAAVDKKGMVHVMMA